MALRTKAEKETRTGLLTEDRPRRGSRPACRHCGIPTAGEGEAFCCAGCAYVYRLVHAEGLEAYYQIKDKVTAPAEAALLPARDFAWLAAAQREAETASGETTPELTLDVQGISCAGCVWLIERVFNKQPGAGRVDVNAQTGQLRMTWQAGRFDAPAFARALQTLNYLLSPASSARSAAPESRALVRRIGLCAAFAMNVMLYTLPSYFGMEASFAYARLFATLSLIFATLSLLAGGGYFLARGFRSLREGAMNIDVPIALGILGAYIGSFAGWVMNDEVFMYFDFVSTFILLMLVGRWAQLAAVERNQRRLLAEQPTPARLRAWTAEGIEIDCAPEKLTPGLQFAVPVGHTVPVEARVCGADVSVSLAWINGESQPRTFRRGQRVPSGAMNLGREDIRLEATQAWKESLLAELMKPSFRTEFRNRFLDRVIQGYLIAILSIAGVSGVVWWLLSGDFVRAASIVTAVLVVSCPCAIGLSFPLADEMAAVALRRRGVFVRVSDLWNRLVKVRKLIFDKTGTLTLETPALKGGQALEELSVYDRRALLTLVADNQHPVARCLHEALLARGELEPFAARVEEDVGLGVCIVESGVEWRLGRPGWAERTGGDEARDENEVTQHSRVGLPVHSRVTRNVSDTLPLSPSAMELWREDEGEDGVDTVLTRAGKPVAVFRFAETARVDAVQEIARLKRRRLDVFVLSGDRRGKVERLARALGLPASHAHAELSPKGKSEWLEMHGADDALMLGDGANDSLAFDRALCRGTPVIHRGVLAEKADFYYLGRGIEGVRALFEVDDARRRTHAALLVFSISYNLLAVGIAVTGQMNPLVAAIVMPLSSLASLGIVGLGMKSVWQRSV